MGLFPPVRVVSGFGGGRPLKNGGGGWNLLTARIDEDILGNNATLILDNFLRINVTAGKAYAFRIEGFFSANGSQDARVGLAGSATLSRLVGMNIRTDNTNVLNVTGPNLYTPNPFTAYPTGIVINTSLNEWSGPFTIKGVVVPAASGTFGFGWCQGTAASPVNPTTRLKGSWMEWKQVD